jgi:hypothetical protein
VHGCARVLRQLDCAHLQPEVARHWPGHCNAVRDRSHASPSGRAEAARVRHNAPNSSIQCETAALLRC